MELTMDYINIFVKLTKELMSFKLYKQKNNTIQKVKNHIWDTLVFDKF